MSEITDRELGFVSPAVSRLGYAAARPRAVAALAVVGLSALGWAYLGIAQSQTDVWSVLCRPLGDEASTNGLALALAMWAAMVLAMMVPSAAPMVLTYAEIGDTAARKNEHVVSPFVLAAGYVVVWLGFAAVATAAQGLIATALSINGAPPLFSATLFIAAGGYQFSALKHACLHQCQSPFPFFFTNWATTPRGVFRLGVKQGLYCLGCCWVAMLLMFAVGTMNIVWMAALAALMTIEKMTQGIWFARLLGTGFIAIGILYLVGVGFG